MNRITFPLRQHMQGAAVADLQDALQALLERSILLSSDEAARRELSDALKRERVEEVYGSATLKLASLFQQAHALPSNGEIDEPTAKALNDLLQQFGLLDVHPAASIASGRLVSGTVRREDAVPMNAVRVRATHEASDVAIRLGEDTTDAQGRYTIRYELLPGVDNVDLRLAVLGEDGELLQSSDIRRDAKPLEIVDLVVPAQRKPATECRIEGKVVLQHGLPASQLKLRLYRLDFGGKATMLGETSTLASGDYAFSYDPAGKPASVELRAVNGAGEEIPLSRPLNDWGAGPRTGLNLVAPVALQPLAPEYRRLSGDLTAQLGELRRLAAAKENEERQDLTILNRATGWDARLIGLAAATERLAADADVGLPQESLYGLLRAGLPSDKLALAQVDPDTAELALKAVRDAHIVELSDAQIAQFKTQFADFATKVRLNVPAPGSRASYGQLLKASGLSPEAQNKFALVYVNHRGDGAALWEEARKAGLGEAELRKLKLQGKLAFLAGNSEGMTAWLMRKQIDDPVQLVDQDLYLADSWVKEVLAQAGIPLARRDTLSDEDKKKLGSEIPINYAAEDVSDRLASYAADMARKVRRSFPTQVVTRLVEQDAIRLPAARDHTVTLLRNAAQQGFRLGETPVQAFLKSHRGVHAGMTDADFAAASRQLNTLHRVYQITPSNEAMPVLLELGMTSAYDVMAYSDAEFTALYARKYADLYGKQPAPGEPQLVYRKAAQVSSVTYNLFTIAAKMDAEPRLAALSARTEVRDGVRDGLIRQFPTMEQLFGSMDFCECEHCRSVLSPAAYLVDLLQFTDSEPQVWSNFLAHWKETHGGQDYPHPKPYDVLTARRPDLPHIALTCENTNTALPYIDIVNEILEYYVAKGALDEGAAHDTGSATTAELLAEPQNVVTGAYEALSAARYPLLLPFDLAMDTVRQFSDYLEAPLARLMEVFAPEYNELFSASRPLDHFTIFMESLRLSPSELAIFVDPDPLAKWHELYGYEQASAATTEAVDSLTGQRIDLNSAKTLARRLGVTYNELTEIVQTGFVNPKLPELAVLYKLGVSIQDARAYLDHKSLLAQDPGSLSVDDQKRRLEAQAFAQKLDELHQRFPTADLEAALQAVPFGAVLVLADTSADGNFDSTTLAHADGSAVGTIEFLRINLFVRLWRKLGWTIEETGRALDAFVPASAPFESAHLGAQPLKTALIYMAHLRTLDQRLGLGNEGRIQLLTLWSDLPVTGSNPLYAQLFLTPGVLQRDTVFDDPLGRYLSAAVDKLVDRAPIVQGALGLTADEMDRILEDAGQSPATAPLSRSNLSLLYRYSLLSKALKLPVRDLIALKRLSGLDPFLPLHPEPLADTAPGVVPPKRAIELDFPFSQTLRFVEMAREVRDSGFDVEDVDYLLRHRIESMGKYASDTGASFPLLKALVAGIRAIRNEHAAPVDPQADDDRVLRQKLLIRQFVIQTITADSGADAALVESLLTDARLVPGPLVEAFAAADSGSGAGFFDTSGKLLDIANSHVDGYLEVPSAGDYRFEVVLEKKDARATLRFDHLPGAVFLDGTAAEDGAVLGVGPNETIELKPGVGYRFSFEAAQLNGGSAWLLVQGDQLPKAGISQLTLYRAETVDAAQRASLLLKKVLQLVRGLGLGEREVRYLLTHRAAFDRVDIVPATSNPGTSLGRLPTDSSEDTPGQAQALFGQFMRWAAYARLRRELALGTGDLIAVFEANDSTDASRLDEKVYPLLARLMCRSELVVKATAEVLAGAPAAPTFESERPVRRLWQALQMVDRFGVAPATLMRWACVASPSVTFAQRYAMARDLREAQKGKFEPQAWQRLAQPIVDRLRQRQRDALAAYVMHKKQFTSREQLYEEFLIDPGMEPVVQTSRIRLAISSLQLFIQRSLLNMEPQVNPSAIDARRWDWMKRYRVWEANRKIFLFPENWLEPEFRDDKTHLFAELEGNLLQGDVSADLAEDAFLDYLKKLDELARLEMVAMHMENSAPEARTLHVIGRTYGKPHKHFYRRYVRQMWTPWEPVSADVQGDHLAPVVWRDRLYLFWVTFIDKPVRNPQYGTRTKSRPLAEVEVSNVAADINAGGGKKQLDVQLHWSEYLDGVWSAPESSALVPVTAPLSVPFGRPFAIAARPGPFTAGAGLTTLQLDLPLTVDDSFDFASVFIHVSKEAYEEGEERGVYVHLRGGGVHQAFYVAGRNAAPESTAAGEPPSNPLRSATRAMAGRYAGGGALTVEFRRRILTEEGKPPVDTVESKNILQQCGAHTLLPCDSAMSTSAAAADIVDLMRPVFFQDKSCTFFVEPTVTERTLEEWQDWVTPPSPPEPGWRRPDWWKDLVVVAETPKIGPPPDPGDRGGGFRVDPGSLIDPQPRYDWLVNPGTALTYEGTLVGPAGRPSPDGDGLAPAAGGLNVVGANGFNAAMLRNLDGPGRMS